MGEKVEVSKIQTQEKNKSGNINSNKAYLVSLRSNIPPADVVKQTKKRYERVNRALNYLENSTNIAKGEKFTALFTGLDQANNAIKMFNSAGLFGTLNEQKDNVLGDKKQDENSLENQEKIKSTQTSQTDFYKSVDITSCLIKFLVNEGSKVYRDIKENIIDKIGSWLKMGTVKKLFHLRSIYKPLKLGFDKLVKGLDIILAINKSLFENIDTNIESRPLNNTNSKGSIVNVFDNILHHKDDLIEVKDRFIGQVKYFRDGINKISSRSHTTITLGWRTWKLITNWTKSNRNILFDVANISDAITNVTFNDDNPLKEFIQSNSKAIKMAGTYIRLVAEKSDPKKGPLGVLFGMLGGLKDVSKESEGKDQPLDNETIIDNKNLKSSLNTQDEAKSLLQPKTLILQKVYNSVKDIGGSAINSYIKVKKNVFRDDEEEIIAIKLNIKKLEEKVSNEYGNEIVLKTNKLFKIIRDCIDKTFFKDPGKRTKVIKGLNVILNLIRDPDTPNKVDIVQTVEALKEGIVNNSRGMKLFTASNFGADEVYELSQWIKENNFSFNKPIFDGSKAYSVSLNSESNSKIKDIISPLIYNFKYIASSLKYNVGEYNKKYDSYFTQDRDVVKDNPNTKKTFNALNRSIKLFQPLLKSQGLTALINIEDIFKDSKEASLLELIATISNDLSSVFDDYQSLLMNNLLKSKQTNSLDNRIQPVKLLLKCLKLLAYDNKTYADSFKNFADEIQKETMYGRPAKLFRLSPNFFQIISGFLYAYNCISSIFSIDDTSMNQFIVQSQDFIDKLVDEKGNIKTGKKEFIEKLKNLNGCTIEKVINEIFGLYIKDKDFREFINKSLLFTFGTMKETRNNQFISQLIEFLKIENNQQNIREIIMQVLKDHGKSAEEGIEQSKSAILLKTIFENKITFDIIGNLFNNGIFNLIFEFIGNNTSKGADFVKACEEQGIANDITNNLEKSNHKFDLFIKILAQVYLNNTKFEESFNNLIDNLNKFIGELSKSDLTNKVDQFLQKEENQEYVKSIIEVLLQNVNKTNETFIDKFKSEAIVKIAQSIFKGKFLEKAHNFLVGTVLRPEFFEKTFKQIYQNQDANTQIVLAKKQFNNLAKEELIGAFKKNFVSLLGTIVPEALALSGELVKDVIKDKAADAVAGAKVLAANVGAKVQQAVSNVLPRSWLTRTNNVKIDNTKEEGGLLKRLLKGRFLRKKDPINEFINGVPKEVLAKEKVKVAIVSEDDSQNIKSIEVKVNDTKEFNRRLASYLSSNLLPGPYYIGIKVGNYRFALQDNRKEKTLGKKEDDTKIVKSNPNTEPTMIGKAWNKFAGGAKGLLETGKSAFGKLCSLLSSNSRDKHFSSTDLQIQASEDNAAGKVQEANTDIARAHIIARPKLIDYGLTGAGIINDMPGINVLLKPSVNIENAENSLQNAIALQNNESIDNSTETSIMPIDYSEQDLKPGLVSKVGDIATAVGGSVIDGLKSAAGGITNFGRSGVGLIKGFFGCKKETTANPPNPTATPPNNIKKPTKVSTKKQNSKGTKTAPKSPKTKTAGWKKKKKGKNKK